MGGQAGSIGLGFAIPANEAKAVAEQLIVDGTVEHAYLGVSLADGTVRVDGAQRRAATISAVTDGTPAADADLQAADAVIAVNGEPLDGAESLIARIRAARPGSSVELTVVRDGTARTVPVTLAVRPTG
jgi:putative serine protease PepD